MEYFDYYLKPDNAPIDVSFVFEDEKPAGKHGFMTVEGDHFEFEDGTPARFWGVNFNGGACFPEHDYAPILAKRLAKFGINMVRFHQMEAEWNTPNIFRHTKGKILDSTRTLDAVSMDRLDFLEKNGVIEINDLSVACHTDFAVIAMSSLSDKKISESNNILLTTIGRARNAGVKFDGPEMTELGEGPVQVENIHAEIKFTTNQQNMRVWSVTPEGCYQGQIPCEWENGVLTFTVGEKWNSMYYLLQAE